MYTTEKANLITEQLERFTSGYDHHVAGHFANLDFWLNEVVAALNTIDGYKPRFEVLREAQRDWVNAHHTRVFAYCPMCKGKCEFDSGVPAPPQRYRHADIAQARKALVDAAYFFLARCYRLGLLDATTLKQHCDFVGTSIDPADLER